jgi:predicted phage terminase large subunit-like protein
MTVFAALLGEERAATVFTDPPYNVPIDVGGTKGKNLFFLGLFRRRLEYPALKRAVREQQNLFNASVVLIEDKVSGTQLIQDLIEDGCHGVTRYPLTGGNTMRMHAQIAMIENGSVHISETAPWLAECLPS